MKDEHNIRVSARTVELTAGDEDDEDTDGWRFGGVAVGENDILYTDDGTPVLFTPEVLATAAETQAGEPLSIDHPADDNGNPIYPPPVDKSPGKVPKAGYVEGKGLIYEANTHDEAIASGVEAGNYEVSVHPQFELTDERDPETGAYIPDPESVNFLDLSVVSKGMSESNTAEWGPNRALASWTRQADIGKEIDSVTAADTADESSSLREKIREMAEDVGLLPQGGTSGMLYLSDQTSDGETVTVSDAAFDDAGWMASLHLEGEEFPDVGPGLGPSIGDGMPHQPGDHRTDEEVELDEALEEAATVYASLRYVTEDGEKSEHIPTGDGGYYVDSATVTVAPDGVIVASDQEQEPNEPAEPGADDDTDTENDMSDPDDPTDDGGQTPDDPDDPDADAGDDGNTVEVDIGDHEDFDRFLETKVTEAVSEATASQDREEMAKEVIASSEQWDEDDREELVASDMLEKIHSQATRTTGASLPGSAGARSQVTAGADADEDDLDAFGTGVQE
ncbi:DUF7282 domain-containing protein [Haloterrigena salifodinae]|uniref:DUF7282 domain-containing protein n=1 Tax=Haloterrigena salifodinae TaxID=2675099 RepID=UPI000F8666A1|nr:hypothetical protein [Haloterrigena salifodinae]